MKTVLLIANGIPHYRVSVYNYLARRFHESGWEMKVASNKVLRESERVMEFEFKQLRHHFADCLTLITELKPEIVILHLHLKIPIYWLLIHWIKLKRIPLVSWSKGGNLDKANSRFRYEIFNYTHRLSDAVLMYSPNETCYIKPKHRKKTFIANNAVNFEDYPVVETSKREIKAEFEITFNKVVLFVGTMGIDGERKRVRHLVDVFAAIGARDVGLILVGSGISREDLLAINPSNTRVLGAVHDEGNAAISKLFKAADIYVVPGHVGLGINQAFHWGLPVISENCNQPPEIQYLKSEQNGFIVENNDLAGLKAKILALLENRELLERLSINARSDIHKEASIEGMFQSFLRAIQFVIRSRQMLGPENKRIFCTARR